MIQFKGYQIREEIYASNRTVIYAGTRQSDNLPVIIKTLASEFPSPEEIAKFQNEFTITRELESAGTIKAYTLEKSFMILEDFGGVALCEYIHSDKISIAEFLSLAVRIVEILDEIHQKGIIHKDINPSNLIWNARKDQLKLIDFGIAARISREKQEVYNPNISEGTLQYISPEQTGRMNRSVDYRSDYYSLGVSFYEMLAGKVPFETKDPIELIHAHLAKEPKPLKLVQAGKKRETVPAVISDIVAKLMSKSPEERYQNANILKLDLEKALLLYKKTGTIYDFDIARNDVSDKFQIPEKLYGFDGEIRQLHDLYENIKNGGAAEIAMVSGSSGSGKSALVNEMSRFMIPGSSYFIRGKYQKFNNEIPYSGISLALKELVRLLLLESDESLARWKESIHQAIYPNGMVITGLVPEFEQITGKQPPLSELDPSESHNRFLFTFASLIRTITSRFPLVVFLDDLQWSDSSSISLIENLLTQDDIEKLFIIGAYRTNETDEGHPLLLAAKRIREKKAIHEVKIRPLDRVSVNQLIAGTLHCSAEKTEPLAKIIHGKTEGNPFFTKEVLNNLYRQEFIFFDYKTGLWDWDTEKISKTGVSDNVAELLNRRLQDLDIETRQLLNLASCLGSVFDFNTLAVVSELSFQEVARAVSNAIVQGFIIPLSANYRLVHFIEYNPEIIISYQFQHDHIRQAAYALVEGEMKMAFHLKIGRLLEKNYMLDNSPERLMDLVQHLNYGRSLIADPLEREKLKKYNLVVGEKARNSNAYGPAFEYLTIAKNLLAEDSWEKDYQLTFRIYKSYAQCAYLCNHPGLAEETCRILLAHAGTNLEKAAVKEMQSVHCNFLWKMEDAVREGIAGLRFLGIKISPRPSMLAILVSLLRVKWALRGKNTESVANQPEISSPEIKLALKLLINFIPPAYMSGNGNLFAVAILKKTLLALKNGNSPETAAAYTGYAALLAGLGDLQGADDFGRMGVRMSGRYSSLEWKSMIHNLYALFSVSWNEDWHKFHDIYKKAIEDGLNSGDLLYTAFAAGFINLWNPGLDLKKQVDESEKYLALIKKTGIETGQLAAQLALQKWKNFRGETTDKFSLDDGQYDELDGFNRMQGIGYESGLAQYYLYKTQICYMYDDFKSAADYVKKSDKIIKSLAGSPYMVEYSLFAFLTCAALCKSSGFREKFFLKRRMQKELKRMKKWADHCPGNFNRHYYLMEAETAGIRNDYFKAADYYNRAILAAEENKFSRYIALNYEMTARFYLANGNTKVGMIYLNDAYNHYVFWGAAGKIRHMDEIYPPVISHAGNIRTITITSKGASTTGSTVDMSTILKASSVISGEIRISALLEKLMKIMIENAGAVRGVFINAEDQLLVEAEGFADKAEVDVLQDIPVAETNNLPLTLIQYVARTGNHVVLKNASTEDEFRNDPYIKTNRIKSVLCAPVVYQGTIVSIFYFENNLVEGAFTPARLEVLNILFTQASISLKNARYYEMLEKRIEERTVELENARYIAEELARTDSLSGLPNRRSFYEQGEIEIGRASRNSLPLSIMQIDVDYFKVINDTYGHAAGDKAIVFLADIFRESIRGADFAGRLGGEEFAILLPDTTLSRAKLLAERIQKSLQKNPIKFGSSEFGFTISFGIAQYNRQGKESLDQLMSRADRALYQAKEEGRNRIVVLKK